jgi:hypothetical protein
VLSALIKLKASSNESFYKLMKDLKGAKTLEGKGVKSGESEKKISPLTVLCNTPSKKALY